MQTFNAFHQDGSNDLICVWKILDRQNLLVTLTILILSFVPNSVSTEWLFSSMGDIKTKKQNRLGVQKLWICALVKDEIQWLHAAEGTAHIWLKYKFGNALLLPILTNLAVMLKMKTLFKQLSEMLLMRMILMRTQRRRKPLIRCNYPPVQEGCWSRFWVWVWSWNHWIWWRILAQQPTFHSNHTSGGHLSLGHDTGDPQVFFSNPYPWTPYLGMGTVFPQVFMGTHSLLWVLTSISI
jgi:hypothetical protein